MSDNLRKTISTILSEAACQSSDYDEILDDDIDCDADECYDDIEDLDEDIEYTEEMVHVMEQSRKDGTSRYIIEYDMLAKLCNSENISLEEAFNRVCEHNSINTRDAYLLLEDSCTFKDSIDEAKAACKSSNSDIKNKAKKKINNAKKQIKNLKGKVNLLKKKDKK